MLQIQKNIITINNYIHIKSKITELYHNEPVNNWININKHIYIIRFKLKISRFHHEIFNFTRTYISYIFKFIVGAIHFLSQWWKKLEWNSRFKKVMVRRFMYVISSSFSEKFLSPFPVSVIHLQKLIIWHTQQSDSEAHL